MDRKEQRQRGDRALAARQLVHRAVALHGRHRQVLDAGRERLLHGSRDGEQADVVGGR